jgi:hypothetical protein
MRDIERRQELRKLWLKTPENKRRGDDVLVFYGRLEQERPELLKRGHGDPYQQLKSDLSGMWSDD